MQAACDLKDSSSVQPEREWAPLDSSHYGINTCLRESIVLLKCSFHALPAEQLPEFLAALQKEPSPAAAGRLLPKRHLAHRRMTLVKGQ